MEKNMGVIDRGIRVLLAVAFGVLYSLNLITGLAALILGGFAMIFIITSILGYCPLYAPFGISTIKKN